MKIQRKFAALSFLLAIFVVGGCGGGNGAASSYTVTFNSQGGSAVAAQTVNPGEKAAEPAAPAPAKTYFTFAGWYKEAGCINAWNFDTEPVNRNVTLFAKWNDQYALRDRGPAGGLIFYLNPDYATDGWRYLEAAPGDQSPGVQWYNGTSVLIFASGSGVAVGTGQANTTAIVTAQGAGIYAAIICDELVIDIYDDWFLPSQEEQKQMYTNLKAASVGGLSGDLYWNSTEYAADTAGVVNFSGDGTGGLLSKSASASVRAVRAF